jgi:hypothetical protein
MFQNYLKIAWRTLSQNKVSALVCVLTNEIVGRKKPVCGDTSLGADSGKAVCEDTTEAEFIKKQTRC